jgi:ATP phosphoribosyltransferase
VLEQEPQGLEDGLQAFGAKVRRRGGNGRAIFTAPKAQAPALADWLIGRGAEEVVVRPVDYVFTRVNPLHERLTSRLDAAR